jgi:hypothetical protein
VTTVYHRYIISVMRTTATGSILVKGVTPELKRRLRAQAERERRSVNQQVLTILERALVPLPPLPRHKPIKPKKPFTHDWLMRAMDEDLK